MSETFRFPCCFLLPSQKKKKKPLNLKNDICYLLSSCRRQLKYYRFFLFELQDLGLFVASGFKNVNRKVHGQIVRAHWILLCIITHNNFLNEIQMLSWTFKKKKDGCWFFFFFSNMSVNLLIFKKSIYLQQKDGTSLYLVIVRQKLH